MTRVDIIAARGTEELLDEAFYSLAGGLWVEDEAEGVRITCYPTDPGLLLAHLRKAGIRFGNVTTTEEEVKDYVAEVRKHFTPVRIGGLTILPPWRKPGKKGRTIVIEPGMAFGTGRHESTKLMAAMMERVPIDGKSVLDIGSGSGVLAINAWLLGASKVAAIDHDPLAAEAMKKNCGLNGRPCISVACGDIDAVKGLYDVVLANLDFGTFERRAPDVIGTVSPGGFLLVSGIEAQYAGEALPLFAPLELVTRRRKGEWHGFIFKRNV